MSWSGHGSLNKLTNNFFILQLQTFELCQIRIESPNKSDRAYKKWLVLSMHQLFAVVIFIICHKYFVIFNEYSFAQF